MKRDIGSSAMESPHSTIHIAVVNEFWELAAEVL